MSRTETLHDDGRAQVSRLRALRPLDTIALNAPPRRVPRSAILLATLASIGAIVWSAQTHSLFLYGDARAHLDVARRVTDGLRTGVTQLGSVWLPMPHIMMVPFTSVRILWHSGAAGWIVSGACYVYASVRVFSLVDELTHDRVAAWVGFALFAVNLDLLYVQTTALTEPVLLAFLVGAAFHLARWMRTFSVRELAWAAGLTMLATLTRYEGWAFLAAGAAVVFVWSARRDRRENATEANVVVYAALGGYGILLWFIYNLTIFHDPLYFLRSTYSAQVMNGAYAKFGLLGTKGHLLESIRVYGWVVIDIVGPAMLVGAGIAMLVLVRKHAQRSRTLLVLALLAAPALFEVVSLYVGQTTIRVPERPPHEMYNDRYALMALPFCAVAIALVVNRRRWLGALLTAGAAAGIVVASFGTPLTIRDGRHGTSSATGGAREVAAAYLHRHYRGGGILADDSEASNTIFAADINLREFVTPGSHPFWDRAIADPARHVRWAISIVPHDAITGDRLAHPDRFEHFKLVLVDRNIRLYERVD